MASGLLLGTQELEPVDAPLRLPDPYLAAFADGGVLTTWLDGCLAIWPRASWQRLADRVTALPVSAEASRTFARLLFASAVEFAFDLAGIDVPEAHRRIAGIEGRAVLVGAGDHAELWSEERWAAESARRLDEGELPPI